MKLGKTARWILTIGILAVLLISLGVMYSRQKAEQSKLTANIAQAQQNFAEYDTQKKQAETRLSQANSDIAAAEGKFCEPVESIEINTALFQAAKDANVTITGLSSSVPADGELNGITFQVFSIAITAEGEVVPALLNFSSKISKAFSTASIESVKINVPEVEEGSESEGKATITLILKIYAYESE
jgi:type II secretory pathway pseudopilin PulG